MKNDILEENNKIFEERYNKLNQKQKEAVEALEGPVMVVAGPGSGKTEIIALRIANIIYKGLARGEEILCLTFTDSASNNMRERLLKIMGSDAYKVRIFTFHAFCSDIIGRYREYFFDAQRFDPISELKQNEILESLFKKFKYGEALYGYREERGYTYFKDAKERIKNFKEAGVTPKEVFEILERNQNDILKIKPLLKNIPPNLRAKEAKEKFKNICIEIGEKGGELGKSLYQRFEPYLEEENYSDIKKNFFKKDEDDNEEFILKEEKYREKLFSVAKLYEDYQKELYRLGYFDFNDMIIYVKDELSKNKNLRSEIEEEFQYILVDEFQDTNLAQIKLIESITNNPVLEGKANVFAVGDDDQSVFKFQGAELNNIFNFQKMYKDVKFIVLTNNYRSTQRVLDFAKEIIEKVDERLVKYNTELVKELISKNDKLKNGNIFINGFNEKEKEYLFVAKEIKKLIDEGIDQNEIAIISRKHDSIQEILSYLDNENISYNYERKESVFEQRHIEILIKICQFLESIADQKEGEADEILPEILSNEFFDIDRINIWEIARRARESKSSWLEIMRNHENEKIREIAKWFIELGVASKSMNLEIILDTIIGSKDFELSGAEEEDEYYNNNILKLKTKFISNYKNYYFGENVLKGDLASYIHFLSSLRVFIKNLREYKNGEKLLISDLSTFIKLHKTYKLALLNKTSFVGDKKAINLMTAHKAKGLEFEYVFLISSEEKIWKSKGNSNILPLPANMPFDRSLDNDDDFLRLFFVGITRAKHTIYITYTNDILSFLADNNNHDVKETNIENTDLKNGLKIYNIPPFAKNEKALLSKLLENYKLSPTHLNNFLNVSKGGPKLFLEQNLLLFPQAKSSSAVYGSAMHKVVETMYLETKKLKKVPSLKELENLLKKEIEKNRLLKEDEENEIKKGIDALNVFYKLNQERVAKEAEKVETEIDFKNEGVHIENALLTGKIDRILVDEEDINIIDLKTGKSFKSFNLNKVKEDKDYENIKKHNYKQQLMFYKILLENSKKYKNKNIKNASLNFLDDKNNLEINIDLENDISKEEWNNFKLLLVRVYNIIKDIDSLQKIDISKYGKSINGILEFEKDLIEGKY